MRWATTSLMLAAALAASPARAGVDWAAHWLVDATYSELRENAPDNPGNRLGIPHWSAATFLRPELSLSLPRTHLVLRPRAQARWTRTDSGAGSQSAHDAEIFINEAHARVRLWSRGHLIAGREVMAWGPSYLLSPSNPFEADNGRDDTSRERPGQDFARLLWIPRQRLSVSAMAHLDDGRLDAAGDFDPGYLLKLDYTGDRWFASMLPWVQPADEPGDVRRDGLGYYLSAQAGEALLLYVEGMALRGDHRMLAGMTYTFLNAANIAFEFYRQNDGCMASLASECPPVVGENTALARRPLRQRDYLLLQLVDGDLLDNLNLSLRAVAGLNDGSANLIALVDRDLGEWGNAYLIANLPVGGRGHEFGGLTRANLRLGLRFYL